MLVLAQSAYNTSFYRVLHKSPFFILRKEDPFLPFDSFVREPKVYYDLDDHKQQVLTPAVRVFRTFEKHMKTEFASTSKYDKGRPKDIKIGDRVFVKNYRR